jgi:carbon-monoxide dehydrogenase medium subunit
VKAAAFTYHDPRDRSDVVALLGSLENAKLLAGGQSLMPMLNFRLLAPDHVIDLNRVEGLAGVTLTDRTIEIGAMTRQAELLQSPEVAAQLPVMAAALTHVGHFQTRSRGTIGGSCAHLDPAAELPAICALYDAEFVVAGRDGGRTVAAPEWFQGFLQSALAEDEMLESIRLARWPDDHVFGFAEYARRHGDFAVAGAAAVMTLDEASLVARAAIVVFGVAPAPVRLFDIEAALVGDKIDAAAIAAARSAARAIDAMGDIHVSASYRQRIAGTVTARALADAGRRAGHLS